MDRLATIDLCTKFDICTFMHYDDMIGSKNAKIGVVWGLEVTQSLETAISIWNSAYDFLFDYNRNYALILYCIRVTVSYSSTVADFNIPHLRLAPRRGWPSSNFAVIFSIRKLESLECGTICIILCLAVLIQYRSVTDRQTHTDARRRHIPR